MKNVEYKLTKVDNFKMLEGSSILFNRMILTKGSIENIYFELEWKYIDPKDNESIVTAKVPFLPQNAVNIYAPMNINIYVFRDYPPLPFFRFDNIEKHAMLRAISKDKSDFELTIYAISDPIFM